MAEKQKGKYIYIDSETQRRYLHSAHIKDLVYDMQGDSTIMQEDVPEIPGSWEDWTGTGGKPAMQQTMFAGVKNELQGSDENIKNGAKTTDLTGRGKNKETHRQRIRRRYVEF
jgi:hypothetical protein